MDPALRQALSAAGGLLSYQASLPIEPLAEQVAGDSGSGLEGGVNLRLVLAASFGDFRFAAPGAADEFCHCAHELASLDAFDEAGRDAGDDGDLAFRLRGGQDDDTFAEHSARRLRRR